MKPQNIEKERKELSKISKILFMISLAFFIIGFLAGIIILAAVHTTNQENASTLVKICFFLAVLVALAATEEYVRAEKKYKKLYKSYFVEQSLKKVFTDVKYEHESGIPAEEVYLTGMMKKGNLFSSNDLITAKYHDVSFKQADITIEQEYIDADDEENQKRTIYKGRWMVFEFPKEFTFRLQVVQKWFGASKKAGKNSVTGRKLKRISTESITFDEKFNVYAEDDFEAYYLLDPAFINHIEQLSEKQEGRIMLCFIFNKLHVAIFDKKDAFEAPSIFKRIDEAAEFAKINKEIKTITDYVDFLKLDHKLFQKPKKEEV